MSRLNRLKRLEEKMKSSTPPQDLSTSSQNLSALPTKNTDDDIVPDGFKKRDDLIPDNVDPETGEIIDNENDDVFETNDNTVVTEEEVEAAFNPYIAIDPDGPFITKSDKFTIGSSIIKHITDQHGNMVDYCPRKIYHIDIAQDFDYQKEVFDYGSYGEYLILGGGAYDDVTDLPKHKKTGKKRVTQKRIEEQAKIHFPRYYKQLFAGTVIPFYTTQIPIYWHIPKYDVVFRGILDHFPAVTYIDGGEPKFAIVDVKFTADIHSTFGMGWGNPDYRDHAQEDLYLRILKNFDLEFNKKMDPLFEEKVGYERIFTDVIQRAIDNDKITFVNLVFSYNKTNPDDGFKPVTRSLYDKAQPLNDVRSRDLDERIRKTIAAIDEMKQMNYQPIPTAEQCKDCPVRKRETGKGYCTKFRELDIT